jgi:hypothetical protein
VHGLRQTYHRDKFVLDASIVLRGEEAQVEAHFSLFEDSANLVAR